MRVAFASFETLFKDMTNKHSNRSAGLRLATGLHSVKIESWSRLGMCMLCESYRCS
jgi:hypothetical protein